jgi:hypothetical protein
MVPLSLAECPDILNVDEFRRVLRIGESQARELLNSGEIRVIRLHQRIIRIPKWAVVKLINGEDAR